MSCIKVAMVGAYPAQACLVEEQIKPSRREHHSHPVTWINALCEGFSGRNDVEAQLFVHSRAVSAIQTGQVAGVQSTFLPKYEPGHLDPVLRDLTASIQMRSHVRRFNPDVVLGFGTESMYGLLSSAFGKPAVIFIQGIVDKLPLDAYGIPKWQHRLLRKMECKAVRRASAVIAENKFAENWARSINSEIQTAVIPHPVASDFLTVQSDYAKRLVFVGSGNANKRPDMIARAFAMICAKHPDAELVLVGSMNRVQDSLDAIIAEYGLENRIHLAGPLRRRGVVGELSHARALVLASMMDTSPNVITEAHAAGLPVIATRVGGIPEMVEHEEDGFLFDVNDLSAMAQYMDLLLTNRQLAEDMGRAGQMKIKALNCSGDVANQYIEFLKKVAGA